MKVLNGIDRFHLVQKVVELVPSTGSQGAYLSQLMKEKLIEHNNYIRDFGIDMKEVSEWQWENKK